MATVAGMAWDEARRWFRTGYDQYQVGGNHQFAFLPGDKRCGLFTAGKDAARKRIPLEKAWRAFREREEAVM